MNYTSEQVIELYSQYQIYLLKYDLNNESVKGTLDFDPFTFENWLKDKESSTPVKGQLIWVREIHSEWRKRRFSHFDEYNKVFTKNIDENALIYWDEYSLTDPNV